MRRTRSRRDVRGPAWCSAGTTLSYLGVMVVLPLVGAGRPGGRARASAAFWKALTDPFAWHALKLTFVTALVDGRRSTP